MAEGIGSLERLEWQQTLFQAPLSRTALMRLTPSWNCRRVNLHVVRNEPFEHIARALRPFLAFAGIEARFTFGPYDDSLTYAARTIPKGCDALIIWLAHERYDLRLGPEQLAHMVADRITQARGRTLAPILVNAWGAEHSRADRYNRSLSNWISSNEGVYLCPQQDIASALGSEYMDERLYTVSGLRLSATAILKTARNFGLRWLPAVLLPPIKGVVLDLDNTIYGGTLVEDGVAGLEMSDAYRCLQDQLLSLQSQGMYLAVASKNHPDDVDELFRTRNDFALRQSHLSAIEANWGPKSNAVLRIASALRVAPSSLLYVDDNAAELAEVLNSVPSIHTVHASSPAMTSAAIASYPGIFTFAVTETARHRVADLDASSLRDRALTEAKDVWGYLAGLEMRLDLVVDPTNDISRLSELSNRVNQFKTSSRRLTEAEVAEYVHGTEYCAVSGALRDRFADSGIISGLFAHTEGGAVVLDDISISCRALGRHVEQVIIAESLLLAVRSLGRDASAAAVRLVFSPTPLNGVAFTCLKGLVGAEMRGDETVMLTISEEIVNAIRTRVPVDVRYGGWKST